MSGIITLKAGSTEANISVMGAWILDFKVANKQILYTKSNIKVANETCKLRGGSHFCFPNFGPDHDNVLRQHGFARDSNWTVLNQQNSCISLELNGDGRYANTTVVLTYELTENSLSMQAHVKNESSSELIFAPGFHPYYHLSSKTARINDINYDSSQLHEPVVLDYIPSTISCDGNTYSIAAENLTKWVLWTDRLADYICLEPTQSEFSFSTPDHHLAIKLAPGHSWQCRHTISV